jgi:anti-sigma factor RsiW
VSGSTGMSCRELVDDITAYLEGTMPDGERHRFDEHLELCPGCRVYIDQMRTTIETVGALREDTLSPETRDSLLAAFRGWRSA